jgi:hypothetical protein
LLHAKEQYFDLFDFKADSHKMHVFLTLFFRVLLLNIAAQRLEQNNALEVDEPHSLQSTIVTGRGVGFNTSPVEV